MPVESLKKICDQIEKELDEKDAVRELAIKFSRTIIRLSGSAICGIHRGEDVSALIKESREELNKMNGVLEGHPELKNIGFVETAYKEFAEVNILLAILENRSVPTPKELLITPTSYLLGLADSVGELRRLVLDALRNDRLEDAMRFLDIMDDVYTLLMRFDYPSGIVAIKRAQDVARSLVEKTRGELAVALRTKRLEDKIELKLM